MHGTISLKSIVMPLAKVYLLLRRYFDPSINQTLLIGCLLQKTKNKKQLLMIILIMLKCLNVSVIPLI